MKLLITGGTGFIGSHTCVRLIKKDHQVVVVDNLCNSSSRYKRMLRIHRVCRTASKLESRKEFTANV